MSTIPLSEITGDVRLALDIRDKAGALILGKGAVLTEVVVGRLKKVGVKEVAVMSIHSLKARLDALEARFTGHEQDAFMMALKREIRTRWEQQASATPAP